MMLAHSWGIHNCCALLTSHLNPQQFIFLIQLGVKVVFALDKEIDIYKDCGQRRFVRFHRLVINAPPDKTVDHKNLNRADNRKKNLRVCERAENDRNRGVYATNTSGITGVHYDRKRAKWVASITYNSKRVFIGRYEYKEDAIMARLTKEVELFKEFAPQRAFLEGLQ